MRDGSGPAGGSSAAVVLAVAALLGAPWTLSPLAAQEPGRSGSAADTLPADSLGVVALDRIVVTGARAPTPLGSSTAALSRLDAPELADLPAAGFADALRRVPGVALLDFDGTGYAPELAVRGFYGGGEAEYVVVLLDGTPLNDLHTGRVAWDLVPPVAVRSVEVLRGGASALWGDAAVGGVVHVLTEDPGAGSTVDWELEAGGHGALEGGVRVAGSAGGDGRDGSLFASARRQDGFREHAARGAATVGGEVDLLAATGDGPAVLAVSAASSWRSLERPGPLTAEALAAERGGFDPLYRFDRTEERVHRTSLEAEPGLGLTGSLTAELRSGDVVRTLPLAPDFADTKARELDSRRLLATLRHDGSEPGLTPGDRLVVGVDAAAGRVDSRYYPVVSGGPEAYAAAGGERGDLDAGGRASRRSAAAFAQYETTPLPPLRVSVGVRVDWLDDRHEPRPVEGGDTGAPSGPETRGHRAVSPRAGLNLRYAQSPGHRGRVYLSAGRSFKAPTLDQLFDQRTIPVPFPPFSATTSNPDLEPQHGTRVEAGLYHRMSVSAGITAGLSLSAYRMDMREELDFDVQSLRYVNIGRSRHDGLELGVEARAPGATRIFLNWALQAATQVGGEHAGRRLKAIPRHFVTGGLSARPVGALAAGVYVTRASGVWLDDANTLPLDPYTRVDARLSWPLAGSTLYLEARNLLDRRYSTTGFPDPAGTGVVYYHPAAGRTLGVGVRSGG